MIFKQVFKKKEIFISLQSVNVLELFIGISGYFKFEFFLLLEFIDFFFLKFKFLPIKFFFYKFCYFFFFFNYELTSRSYYNFTTFFLNKIFYKKLYRVVRGLPLNGQSCLSNGWSVRRSNNSYIDFLVKLYAIIFKRKSVVSLQKIIIADIVNKSWFFSWGDEWLLARKLYNERAAARVECGKRKNTKGAIINIDMLVRFEVYNPNKIVEDKVVKKKKRKKPKQVVLTQEYATVGSPFFLIKFICRGNLLSGWSVMYSTPDLRKHRHVSNYKKS